MSKFKKVIFTSFGVFLLSILVAVPSSSAKNIILSEDVADSVGIGTVSPGQKLDVIGNVRFSGSLMSTGGIGTRVLEINGNDGIKQISANGGLKIGRDDALIIGAGEAATTIESNVSATGEVIYVGADSGVLLITSPDNWASGWAGRNQITFTASGNLGINDDTPTYKLDVNGTGRFTGALTVSTPTASAHAATKDYVDTAVGGAGGLSGSGTINYMTKWTGAGSVGNSIAFDNGTNVGISDTTPTYKLDVNGTGRFVGALSANSTITATGLITANSGLAVSNDNITGVEEFRSAVNATYPKIVLDSSGSGSNTVEQAASISIGESGTGSAALHFTYTGDGYGHIGMGSISAAIPTYEVMRLYYGDNRVRMPGRLMIGSTASPSYPLHVTGAGYFTGTATVATPTADAHAATKAYVDTAVAGAGGSDIYWTGTSTNLVAATGRTSLGLGSLATQSAVTDAQVPNNITIDHAGTATSLSANGSNCSAGYYPLGVNASGAVESCTLASAGGSDIYWTGTSTNLVASTGRTSLGLGSLATQSAVTDAQVPNNITIDHAGTATSLSANGSNCSAGYYPLGVNASGAVESCTLAPAGTGDITAVNSGVGTKGGATSGAATIEFDCSEVDGNQLTCIGEVLQVSEGAGSGLDADLLDGHSSSYFAVAGASGITGSGTANYISKWTGTTAQGNSQIFDNGTNVGIGMAAPTAKLEVEGTGIFKGVVTISTPTAGSHAATKDYVDAALGSLPVGTSSQTLMYQIVKEIGTWVPNSNIHNTGNNVGIGTTLPTQKLHVNGSIIAGGYYSSFGHAGISELYQATNWNGSACVQNFENGLLTSTTCTIAQ